MNQFQQLEEQFSRETSVIKIDDSTCSANLLSFYLRGFRSRNDLASLIHQTQNDDSIFAKVESARTLIQLNKLNEAENILENITTNDEYERAEVLLEKSRIHLFRKELDMVIGTVSRAQKLKNISPVTLLTMLQICGDAHIQLQQIDEAIVVLKMAITIAEIYPLSTSAFSSFGFLVLAYIRNKDMENAQKYLEILKKKVELCDQEEMWIGRLVVYLRTAFHYYLAVSDKNMAKTKLCEARIIAKWMDDQQIINKCENDLKSLEDVVIPEPTTIISFKTWDFLPGQNLILCYEPKKIIRIDNAPTTLKILLLLAQGPIHIADFFKEIWNLEYCSEKHYQHVRSTLSKIRKKLPVSVLRLEENFINLI